MNRHLEPGEKLLASKSGSDTTFYSVFGCTTDCPDTVEVMDIRDGRPHTISEGLYLSNLVLRENTVYYAVSDGEETTWIRSFTEGEKTICELEVMAGVRGMMIQVNAECTRLFYTDMKKIVVIELVKEAKEK